MNTYAILSLNSFGMCTYAMGNFLKAFGMNTCARWGGGEGYTASRDISAKSQSSPSCEKSSPIMSRAFPGRFPRPTSPLTWTRVQSYHYLSAPLKRIVLHAEWLRGSGPTKPRQPDQRHSTGR